MKLRIFLLTLLVESAFSQGQQPIAVGGGNAAARPPGAAGNEAAGAPAGGPPPSTGGSAAARPPSAGAPAAAAAAPPSGNSAARPPSSGGSAAAPPASGGGAAARPPSSGGSAAAPPASGGGAAARPPSSGGSAAAPPASGGGGGAAAGPPSAGGSVAIPPTNGGGDAAAPPSSDGGAAAQPPDSGNTATPPPSPGSGSPYCPVDKAIPALGALAGRYTTNTTCPGESDGKLFTTSGGLDFRISCFHHKNNGQVLDTKPQPTFEACMNMCEQSPGCRSVSYAPRYANVNDRQCKMISDATDDAAVCTPSYADTLPNHDFAIIVDPPYVEAPPEEPSARCSTECPGAHGKIYQTESGESFRTECCKRHGTKPLAKVYAQSNLECMEKCASVSQCSSSEFQIASGSCFLGDRHSPPTLNARAWASTYSIGCAGACKACQDCSKQTLLGGPEISVLGAA